MSASPAANCVAITGVGVCCVAGDEPAAAWSAAVLNLNVAAPDETTVAPRGNGQGVAPAMTVPMAELAAAGLTGGDRLAELLRRAARSLPMAGIDSSRLQVRVALPPARSARRHGVREEELVEACIGLWPGLPRENVHLVDGTDGVAAPLFGAARDALRQGLCDAVVVGAVDSLTNRATCLELSQEDRLMTQGDDSGLMPGEAGAFLLLETEGLARSRGLQSRAFLAAVADAPEPHFGAADLHTMSGLATAIEAALAQAKVAAGAIDGMVISAGQEISDGLELYQTTQRLWPRRVDERQRLAVELDELDPAAMELPEDPVPPELRTSIAFGELGVATLPMELALATEWFASGRRDALFGIESQRRHLLACETGAMPRRGAVIVTVAEVA